MKKRIIIWCGDAPNQKALTLKIAKEYSIDGIIIEKKKSNNKKRNLPRYISKLIDRVKFNAIYSAWKNLQKYYEKNYPDWPSKQILKVESINCNEVKEFSASLSPDLIIVSGTRLIKAPLFDIDASIGIINLHTGLSPYIKGGPNCTNWCIANNDWHLIGNTVMWINEGIDSGNIITNERIDIRKAASLFEAQKMVMEHAHNLYIRAIRYLLTGRPPYVSIAQSFLGIGKTFYNKMWTRHEKRALLKNWKTRKQISLEQQLPRTIDLPV